MIYIATKGELRQFSGIPVLYLSHSSLDFTAHCLIREDVETHLFFFPSFRILVVSLQEKIAAFDSCTFTKKFFVTSE